MASCTKSPKICCHTPAEDFEDAAEDQSAAAIGMAGGGGLQPQPASGEVLEMMGEEISQEHHRSIKIPYGSLDPAATIAGSALKGC